MGYTNSPMVVYTKLSPNHSGQRTMAIDRITPHCVVGQCTAEGLGDWFYKSSTQAWPFNLSFVGRRHGYSWPESMAQVAVYVFKLQE